MGFKERKKVYFSHDLKKFLTEIFYIFYIGEKSGEKFTTSDAAMRIRQALSVTQYLRDLLCHGGNRYSSQIMF